VPAELQVCQSPTAASDWTVSVDIFKWILLGGFGVFLASAVYSIIQILILGSSDHSRPSGKIGLGLLYAFTASMSPRKKESAYLHLPTYSAGILYHIGTFLCIMLLVTHLLDFEFGRLLGLLLSGILLISAACGMGILLKRVSKPAMRLLSTPDDYASNLLVTGFQVISVMTLQLPGMQPYLFIYGALLFIYVPISKLRHTIYFFTSRFFLGLVFGRRGVWPSGKKIR